jgi:oxygen-independent coproporphyrinogen-3 oxidase
LTAEGYREIGMDHFALESDVLYQASRKKTLHRNFMGYAPRLVAPLIGLGVSSISDSSDAFAQNEKNLEIYKKRVSEGEIPIFRGHKLNREDVVLRRHILNLMTRVETSWDTPEAYVPYLDSVTERLEELRRDGLVKLSGKICKVTDNGRAFLRNICMAFDARLARDSSSKQLFSRTI